MKNFDSCGMCNILKFAVLPILIISFFIWFGLKAIYPYLLNSLPNEQYHGGLLYNYQTLISTTIAILAIIVSALTVFIPFMIKRTKARLALKTKIQELLLQLEALSNPESKVSLNEENVRRFYIAKITASLPSDTHHFLSPIEMLYFTFLHSNIKTINITNEYLSDCLRDLENKKRINSLEPYKDIQGKVNKAKKSILKNTLPIINILIQNAIQSIYDLYPDIPRTKTGKRKIKTAKSNRRKK